MKLFFIILLLQFSALSFGDDVFMAFGESIPPFSFPETDSGIEIEVISEALAYQNHKLIPVYYPLARVPISFKLKQVGAAMTNLGQDMSKIGAYYGDSAVVYDNVFITLKKTTSLSSNLKTLRAYRLSHFKVRLNVTHCGWTQ